MPEYTVCEHVLYIILYNSLLDKVILITCTFTWVMSITCTVHVHVHVRTLINSVTSGKVNNV